MSCRVPGAPHAGSGLEGDRSTESSTSLTEGHSCRVPHTPVFARGVFDFAFHFKSATPVFAAAARKLLSRVASGTLSRRANSRYTAS